jgi:tetratricopeptide (TPR) repeat protein
MAHLPNLKESMALAFALILCSCSGRVGRVSVTSDHESNVQGGVDPISHPGNERDFQGELEMEAAVSDRCLEAWRKEIKGDTKAALSQLDELEHLYPRSNTVSMMKGQVLEHSGNKKEAIQYYRAAVSGNELSDIHTFKLAELLRTTGDIKGAIVQYRKLLQGSPNFLDAHLGLAKCLRMQDAGSQEANSEIELVLKQDPENKEALALKNGSKAANAK